MGNPCEMTSIINCTQAERSMHALDVVCLFPGTILYLSGNTQLMRRHIVF